MQKGQALAEALILLIILGALFVAIMWLGRLQDIALQLSHASRHSAFKLAYQKHDIAQDEYFADYLRNSSWLKRDGNNLPDNYELTVNNTNTNSYASAGKKFSQPLQLFDELKLADKQIWRFTASSLINGDNSVRSKDSNAGYTLANFDLQQLQLSRFTAIMRAVPSINSDEQVQNNLSDSPSAWGQMARHSIGIGQQVTNRLKGVDSGWGRSMPNWDWLKSWTARIPARHLSNRGGL